MARGIGHQAIEPLLVPYLWPLHHFSSFSLLSSHRRDLPTPGDLPKASSGKPLTFAVHMATSRQSPRHSRTFGAMMSSCTRGTLKLSSSQIVSALCRSYIVLAAEVWTTMGCMNRRNSSSTEQSPRHSLTTC